MPFSDYTTLTTEAALQKLKSSIKNGLANDEAEERLKQSGFNLISQQENHWWQILFRQFRSPFVYLLLAAALLTLFLGDLVEGLMILFFVFFNAGLSFYQEYHSEQSLKILKHFLTSQAHVLRNGQEILIDAKLLVPGDILILETGDMVPADVRLLEENNLTVDESVLTGESVPIKKTVSPLLKKSEDLFKILNVVFNGTTIVGGMAKGLVIATGKSTAFGEIAKATAETVKLSGFEKNLAKFSKFILRLILVTLVFVFLANLFIKQGSSIDLIALIVFAIALAVSVIPEALPLVTTFSLSRGAVHLAKKKVVVKRLSAIEDLGSMEVLCTDKTGTLTENLLTVSRVLPEGTHDVLLYGSLAASFLNEKQREPNNAFDLALWKELSPQQRQELNHHQRLQELPFDPEKKINLVSVALHHKVELIARGAHEVILKLVDLPSKKVNDYLNWANRQGREGKRVIAVAKKRITKDLSLSWAETKQGLELVGLIAFQDPLKKSVVHSVKLAQELGVKIKILTGDAPEVAGAVAYQVGLVKFPEAVITAEQFFSLSHERQSEILETYQVFARVSPLQKHQLVDLLQEKYRVGFLGEGINDAPALKSADVALVVQSASDIAREAADIVLLKKSLQVIIEGIKEGRTIFANTVKYIKATLISNFGNFFAIAIASLIVDFLPMLPVQLLLLNLLSDFPMISIAADKVDQDELKSPKTYDLKEIVLIATILGLVSTVFDFIYFSLFYRQGPETLQTNWYIGSVLTELLLLFSIRTKKTFFRGTRPASTVLWLTSLAFLGTIIIPLTNFGQTLFKFNRPSGRHLLIIISVALVYFIITELVKHFYNLFIQPAKKKAIVSPK